MKWQRINETCLRATDEEGNKWCFVAYQGKYLGKHWGHRGYEGRLHLFKNDEEIEVCNMNFAWSQIKHLTPRYLKYFKSFTPDKNVIEPKPFKGEPEEPLAWIKIPKCQACGEHASTNFVKGKELCKHCTP